eukprot:GHRR01001714.1.p1 GENE.GHRR01001714.1~~GHRR01001714.1.p1  ORF type:complete len:571 (+),score=179.62 GHRR01001714.1:372-2084(+)
MVQGSYGVTGNMPTFARLTCEQHCGDCFDGATNCKGAAPCSSAYGNLCSSANQGMTGDRSMLYANYRGMQAYGRVGVDSCSHAPSAYGDSANGLEACVQQQRVSQQQVQGCMWSTEAQQQYSSLHHKPARTAFAIAATGKGFYDVSLASDCQFMSRAASTTSSTFAGEALQQQDQPFAARAASYGSVGTHYTRSSSVELCLDPECWHDACCDAPTASCASSERCQPQCHSKQMVSSGVATSSADSMHADPVTGQHEFGISNQVDMYCTDTLSDDMGEDDIVSPGYNPIKMADLAFAANAVSSAQHAAAAAKHAAVLQVLQKVASQRKQEPVLTAAPAAAAAAGCLSVRPRLIVTEVAVYADHAANTPFALEQANRLMARMVLPGGVKFMPVLADSMLFKAAVAWQFPAFVVCLGSSYLQRMLASVPVLANAALACPGFEDYCGYLPSKARLDSVQRYTGEDAQAACATLRSIQFTCLFIALKVADSMHALGLLRYMLTQLSHTGQVVSLQQAADVEARCLDALDWRLGPYFFEDDLLGNDEELWLEGMGNWEYGSRADVIAGARAIGSLV